MRGDTFFKQEIPQGDFPLWNLLFKKGLGFKLFDGIDVFRFELLERVNPFLLISSS